MKGDDFKAEVEKGASDTKWRWLDSHGEKKTPEEVKAWSDEMEKANPYENPEKREWFVEQVAARPRSGEDDALRLARGRRQGELPEGRRTRADLGTSVCRRSYVSNEWRHAGIVTARQIRFCIMGISLKPQHLNRYRQIAWLFVKYGRSDLVKETGLEETLDSRAARHAQRKRRRRASWPTTWKSSGRLS